MAPDRFQDADRGSPVRDDDPVDPDSNPAAQVRTWVLADEWEVMGLEAQVSDVVQVQGYRR
jgi:hypothetical protein